MVRVEQVMRAGANPILCFTFILLCSMDLSSNSIPEEAVVKHLDWTLTVDFEENVIQTEATYTMDIQRPI